MQLAKWIRLLVLHVRIGRILILAIHHWMIGSHIVAILILQNIRGDLCMLRHN